MAGSSSFFEKKEPKKLLSTGARGSKGLTPNGQKFLGHFFQKGTACFLAVLLSHAAIAQERPRATGTGFIVGETLALTNNHVIDGCQRVAVRTADKRTETVKIRATDKRRDLALLELPRGLGPLLTFRESPPVARGESVVTYGFPLSGVLSSGPSLTTGDVSALAGLRDNPLHLQISAPVQPGNSGGPLLDSHGLVVGIVVAKLNALRMAQATGGDIPQNVNFAIKGTEAVAFMRENRATPSVSPSVGPDRKPADIGETVNPAVLFVQCFGGAAETVAAMTKPANDPSFTLVNKGPRVISELFATPSGRGNWGRDRMEGHALAAGQSHLFRLPPQEGCVWDLKVVSNDGKSLERKNANLCRMTELTVP
jgi:S1-C subfamily serine protease